jgi:predicted nucleic acid-binding protein
LIVVADTSPTLSLARISRLDFLRVLYQQVLIPSAVYRNSERFHRSPKVTSTSTQFRD